jgi:hypothetical protein
LLMILDNQSLLAVTFSRISLIFSPFNPIGNIAYGSYSIESKSFLQ